MASLLDNFEMIDKHMSYINEDGNCVIESTNDCPLIDMIEEPVPTKDIDPENPKLTAFHELLFNQSYHQLDIREWVC